MDNWVQDLIWSWTSVLELAMIRFACAKTQKEVWEIFLFSGKGTLRMYLPTCCAMITYFTLAKTEIIYPKNVGALVAMNFT